MDNCIRRPDTNNGGGDDGSSLFVPTHPSWRPRHKRMGAHPLHRLPPPRHPLPRPPQKRPQIVAQPAAAGHCQPLNRISATAVFNRAGRLEQKSNGPGPLPSNTHSQSKAHPEEGPLGTSPATLNQHKAAIPLPRFLFFLFWLSLTLGFLCPSSYALFVLPAAEEGRRPIQHEVQPRRPVFREIGDRLSGESEEDAIYEEVEYYLDEEEPPQQDSAKTDPKKLIIKHPLNGGSGDRGAEWSNKKKAKENATAKAVEATATSLLMCLKYKVVLAGNFNSSRSHTFRQRQQLLLFPAGFLLHFLLLFLLSFATVVQAMRDDTEILSQLLNRGYDWRVRPPGTNLSMPGDHGPVVVNINMLIRSISKIDDVNMEYSAQLTFREEWVDGRLAYGLPKDNRPDHIILTAGQQIWMPDTFFQNEKQARKHEIDKPNVLIRIYKDGRILYSVRISLVLSCPMFLQYYPMDIQTCLIDMASYAYTDTDIEYRWKEEKPVQQKEGLESSLPSFQLTNVTTGYCTSQTNTGTYSCLRTVLTLRRQFSYYLLQLYIPSSMLVIVSWVSFWLDRTAVPARVTLGVTTLLTMTTQTSGINAKLPPVSYSKAIDIWCGACLAFIFSALLEFACVTYISSRMFYKRRRNSRVMGRLPLYNSSGGCAGGNRHCSRRQSMCPHCHFETPTAQLLAHRPSLRYTPLTGQQFMDEETDEVWVRRKEVPPLSLPQSDNRKASICLPPPDNNSQLDHQHQLGSPRGSSHSAKKQPRPSLLVSSIRRLPPLSWLQRRLAAEDPAKRADYISRILFPLAFALFNLVYWLRYLMF